MSDERSLAERTRESHQWDTRTEHPRERREERTRAERQHAALVRAAEEERVYEAQLRLREERVYEEHLRAARMPEAHVRLFRRNTAFLCLCHSPQPEQRLLRPSVRMRTSTPTRITTGWR